MGVIQEASHLTAEGLAVLLLRGKIPVGGHAYLDATDDIDRLKRLDGSYPGANNLGIAPGACDPPLVVIDIDENKDEADAPSLGRWRREVEPRLQKEGIRTLTVWTGGGGRHLYFLADGKRPIGQKNGIRDPGSEHQRVEAGIDVRGEKGYVVVPPSVHPRTGKAYTWDTESGEFDWDEVQPIPGWLLDWLDPPDLIYKNTGGPGWKPPELPDDGDAVRRVEGMVEKACDELARLGEGMSRRTEIQRAAYRLAGLLWTGYPKERLLASLQSAARACGKWNKDMRRTIADAVEDGEGAPYPLPPDSESWTERRAKRGRILDALRRWGTRDREDVEEAPEDMPPEGQPDPEVAWRLDVNTNKDGEVTSIVASYRNAMLLFEVDKRWAGRLQYNEFTGEEELDGKDIQDHDLTEAASWVDEAYGCRLSIDHVSRGMLAVARRNPYHPVRDWLRSLEWDGENRLDGFLHWWMGCEWTEDGLTGVYGRKWAIGCVARIMQPGCKLDTALVLQGKQGVGKSTSFAVLVGAEWFSDSPIDLEKAEVGHHLQGIWVYENAELESTRRATSQAVKRFLSQRDDKYRAPYARRYVRRPRQVVTVGTTNEVSFLGDRTGDRRFWVRRVVKAADLESLGEFREQLWAEAVARYDADETWWLDTFEEKLRQGDNEQFRHIDVWTEAVDRWVSERGDGFTLADCFDGALRLRPSDVSKADEMRLGGVLQELGLQKKRQRRRGSRVTIWVLPEDSDDG